ncbi:MAG TPA: shikimate kinase [Ktedonosporobacter sp.]|nr:shikimate kinase [Ktedonosporobacter sp.]
MLKIHILGGPGSGKTTLGQEIASRLHIPHYDLDKIGWKYAGQMAAGMDEIFAIARQPAWVTENIGLIWTDPLLYQADCIVLLEVPWPVAVWRIICRHIGKTLNGTNPYRTRLLFPFLKDTRRYYVDKVSADPSMAEAVHAYLEEHEGDGAKVADAEALLTCFEKYSCVIPLTADFVCMYLEKYKEKVFFVKNHADRERLFALLQCD